VTLITTAPTGATAAQLRLLGGLARDLAAAEALWRPRVRFDALARPAIRLPAPPGTEAWLGTWLPGQHSDLHDHGSTAAALVVVEGALVEHQPDAPDGPLLVRLDTGDVAGLEPGALHRVGNDDDVPAVSIHVRTTVAARS
jgi:hypothetical protein